MGSRVPHRQVLQSAIERDFRRSRPGTSSVAAAAALCAALGLAASTSAEASNTYTVTNNSDSGLGSLRNAIGLANVAAGNTVQFDASLKGSTITLTTGQIEIDQPMTIAGPGTNLLTISGGHQTRILYAHTQTSSFLTISGLTLTAGGGPGFDGAAIAATQSSLYLQGVTISDSVARNGGGVFVREGVLKLFDSRVEGNVADMNGGGVYAINSNLLIVRSTISSNTAGEYGGGVYANGLFTSPVLLIGKSAITRNTIPPPGGPVFQGGGGIAMKGTPSGFVQIYRTTVALNYSYQNAGGIALLDAGTAANTSISYLTIVGNSSAASAGNGITAPNGTTVHTDRSIMAGNSSHNGISDLSGQFELLRCLVQNPDSATIVAASSGNLFLISPQLTALADHGGPTLTMLPVPGSPVVDAGGPCSFFDTDQRGLGFSSCVNSVVDIGAVERQSPEDIIFRDGYDNSS